MAASAATSSNGMAFADAGLASSSSQVRLSKAALVFNIGSCFKNSFGHGASEPSFPSKSKAPSSLGIPRGRRSLCNQEREPRIEARGRQSLWNPKREPQIEAQQDFEAGDRFRERLSPANPLQELSDDFRDRRSQSAASFLPWKAVLQAAKGEAWEQWRNHQVSSVHQEGMHSSGQGSSDSSRSSPPNNGVSAGNKLHLPKRRGTRNSARGIDVIDDLMSLQGRSSKALLESLQSEVALAKDPELKFQRDSAKDVSAGPFSARKFPEKNDVPQDQAEIYGMAAKPSERPRPSDSLSGSALTLDIFPSAIENALSPLVSANLTHPNNTSSQNADVGQHGAQVVSVLQSASETRQPGLRGQEVLWALQKAAIEKAKRKQKVRKPNEKAVKVRERMPLQDASEWKNAKPIVLKHEWSLQIDDLERRIQSLKKPI